MTLHNEWLNLKINVFVVIIIFTETCDCMNRTQHYTYTLLFHSTHKCGYRLYSNRMTCFDQCVKTSKTYIYNENRYYMMRLRRKKETSKSLMSIYGTSIYKDSK